MLQVNPFLGSLKICFCFCTFFFLLRGEGRGGGRLKNFADVSFFDFLNDVVLYDVASIVAFDRSDFFLSLEIFDIFCSKICVIMEQ